jgi:hypothetical protein
MVDAFNADNDEFQIIKNDKITFDTNAPSVSLFPDSTKIVQTRQIHFPDLVSGILYFRQGGSGISSYCESWSSLMWQEWGYGYSDSSPVVDDFTLHGPSPVTRNLPQDWIGSVPSDTDYIDVRVRLRRTKAPPTFMDDSPPFLLFPENQWIYLPGGSCTCELFNPLIRHFDIVREGTNVYLRRYQSVAYYGEVTDSGSGNENGWTYNAGSQYGNYGDAPAGYSRQVVKLDQKSGGSGTKRAPWADQSDNACSVSSNLDYSSNYDADIEIHPGRYAA